MKEVSKRVLLAVTLVVIGMFFIPLLLDLMTFSLDMGIAVGDWIFGG